MNRRVQPEDWLGVARKSPLFEGASEEALRELSTMALCHDYPKNNILFYQGDPGRAVYLVLSGEVKISLTNEEAKEVIVRLVRPGGLVGLTSMVDGGPQPANATTVSRSRLARFNGQELMDWMAKRVTPRPLLRELAASVRQCYQKIGEHALLTVKERLLSALLEIAEREGEPQPGGEGVVFFTRPTHQELADRIGSSREVVSRMLKELLDSDLLEAEGKVIRVSESALVLREE